MKLGVTGFPPLSFRAISMWLGLPVLWALLRWQQVPFFIRRADWAELAKLSLTNMIVWHIVAILAIQALSSGRTAILGYTMPIFSALWGVALFGERLRPRHLAGVAAAGLGVALLLWHEFGALTGRPLAAVGMLFAAAVWALGGAESRKVDLPFLQHASGSAHPAVVANAAAALAALGHAATAVSATVRLLTRDGQPLADEWVRFNAPGVGPVWTKTGVTGYARVFGLPASGHWEATLINAGLVLEHAGDSLGKISRNEVRRP